MINTCLDIERLGSLVRKKRGTRTLREISTEIGNVSPSTLSRIENWCTPDMETFLALCDWLQVRPGNLFLTDHKQQELDTAEEIVILILSDKNLKPDIAYTLSQIIKATYRYLLE